MNDTTKNSLRVNLNRLVMIAAALLSLKLFTYAIVEFFPVFGSTLGTVVSALLPFILAFIISFLLEPLILKLINVLKIKRTYASLLVVVLVMIVFVLLLVLFGSRIYRELAELYTAFPMIYQQTLAMLTEKIGLIQQFIQLNPEINSAIQSNMEKILVALQVILKNGSLGLLNFLGALPGLMFVIVITTVATLLTSMSFPAVKEWLFGRVKGKYLGKTRQIAADLGSALVGFLRAQTILVCITFAVITIGLLIIGNSYAFTLGILSGLLDLIPVIGPALIFIPWILVLLFTGSIASAVKILVIYLAATVIRQVLEPKILSHNIGLHPLATLMSMYIGMNLFGAVGLIIGPTLVVMYEAVRKAGFFKGE
ncbi:hypothetical protein UNSWDHB_1546 [Dehalobacter sp. UNSWDHB]|uniref:sporulation integral membrane protein YtvI n=1 Tax=unclassified Dehalobacter TaxID=2635733 RepID=UPI0002F35FF5|nr:MULTISPECIES: sporulation integral membrane protein YtvI [unclassified Dehalobacter]EQB21158.1 hypothetical protein UNSWDHB_1546 [Dehalobacter sp. UNSWDHB]